MINKIVFITALLFFSVIFSQSDKVFLGENYPKEDIKVHYNNELLVTGERLYYKIYNLDNNYNFSKYSKTAYLELRSSDNKTLISHRISLKDGTGYGNFFINTSIKTGVYKLICYTEWMKNYNSCYENNIFIVNPFSDNLSSFSKLDSIKVLSQANKITSKDNKSLLNKSTYKKREKVSLNLENITSNLLNFSVSVKKKTNFNLSLNDRDITTEKNKPLNQMFFLPELYGSIIHGYITSKNSNNLSNIRLTLSTNDNSLPLMATTNSLGGFNFIMPNINTNKIYIQITSETEKDYKINIERHKTTTIKLSEYPNIMLNEEALEVIKNRVIYSQIENSYYSVKKDSIITPLIKNNLLESSKNVYKLDNYKRFKTVKETFTEIIDLAKITKRKEKYKFNVLETENHKSKSISNLPTLLIVDGHIIINHNDFINFDSRKINKISVINHEYFYGNSIYKGIIYIETLKKDYKPNNKRMSEFEVMITQPQKKYFFDNYDLDKKNRIPDYRTQLFWTPNVSNKTKKLAFYTSDIPGVYEIEIFGYTTEGSQKLYKSEFRVN